MSHLVRDGSTDDWMTEFLNEAKRTISEIPTKNSVIDDVEAIRRDVNEINWTVRLIRIFYSVRNNPTLKPLLSNLCISNSGLRITAEIYFVIDTFKNCDRKAYVAALNILLEIYYGICHMKDSAFLSDRVLKLILRLHELFKQKSNLIRWFYRFFSIKFIYGSTTGLYFFLKMQYSLDQENYNNLIIYIHDYLRRVNNGTLNEENRKEQLELISLKCFGNNEYMVRGFMKFLTGGHEMFVPPIGFNLPSILLDASPLEYTERRILAKFNRKAAELESTKLGFFTSISARRRYLEWSTWESCREDETLWGCLDIWEEKCETGEDRVNTCKGEELYLREKVKADGNEDNTSVKPILKCDQSTETTEESERQSRAEFKVETKYRIDESDDGSEPKLPYAVVVERNTPFKDGGDCITAKDSGADKEETAAEDSCESVKCDSLVEKVKETVALSSDKGGAKDETEFRTKRNNAGDNEEACTESNVKSYRIGQESEVESSFDAEMVDDDEITEDPHDIGWSKVKRKSRIKKTCEEPVVDFNPYATLEVMEETNTEQSKDDKSFEIEAEKIHKEGSILLNTETNYEDENTRGPSEIEKAKTEVEFGTVRDSTSEQEKSCREFNVEDKFDAENNRKENYTKDAVCKKESMVGRNSGLDASDIANSNLGEVELPRPDTMKKKRKRKNRSGGKKGKNKENKCPKCSAEEVDDEKNVVQSRNKGETKVETETRTDSTETCEKTSGKPTAKGHHKDKMSEKVKITSQENDRGGSEFETESQNDKIHTGGDRKTGKESKVASSFDAEMVNDAQIRREPIVKPEKTKKEKNTAKPSAKASEIEAKSCPETNIVHENIKRELIGDPHKSEKGKTEELTRQPVQEIQQKDIEETKMNEENQDEELLGKPKYSYLWNLLCFLWLSKVVYVGSSIFIRWFSYFYQYLTSFFK